MWFMCQLIQKFMVKQKTIYLCNVHPLSSAIKQLHNGQKCIENLSFKILLNFRYNIVDSVYIKDISMLHKIEFKIWKIDYSVFKIT